MGSPTESSLSTIDPGTVVDVIRSFVERAIPAEELTSAGLSDMDAGTSLYTLPIDSISMIELIDDLNDAFNSDVRPDDVYKAQSVGDVVALVVESAGPR
ncbi:acyl carrier protein [Nocardia sp. NPDC005825]|uniref:acyl carrier protein n=1 Tax=unclassified Nocardia TaxID=2637762 RepID=UPI0033DB07C0